MHEVLPAALPASSACNDLAHELNKLREKGIAKPFVHLPASRFTPEWQLETFKVGYMLQPQLLMPSLLRWAMAAQSVGMIPMHAGMVHADICMRVAAEAKNKNKYSTAAATYDELVQTNIAEMSLKGVDGLDPVAMLCRFDRETMEQAFALAEKRMKHSNEGHGSHHGQNRNHGQSNYKSSWGSSSQRDSKWQQKRSWNGDQKLQDNRRKW